jgi:hypothetical protein
MKNFKKGDKVVMHTCGEADFTKYKGKIWTCLYDSSKMKSQIEQPELVFLEGFSGSFLCDYLQIVNVKSTQKEAFNEGIQKSLTLLGESIKGGHNTKSLKGKIQKAVKFGSESQTIDK